MANGENCHDIIVNAVSGHMAAVAEVDEPFPKPLGHVINHSADMGMCAKYLHALPDCFARPARGIRILRAQKIPQPLQVPDRGPPPLKWSAVMFRKRRIENGKHATEAGRDWLEVAAG